MLDLRAQYETISHEITAAIGEVLSSQQFVLGPQGWSCSKEIAQACGCSLLALALPPEPRHWNWLYTPAG